MWTTVVTALGSLFSGWLETKKAKQEAEAAYHRAKLQGELDWDTEAMRQAQFSWKDELFVIVWLSPLVVAWVYPEKAQEWLDFVGEMPYWYQIGMFGMMAASFGLRWFFKSEGFKVMKGKNNG